MTITTPSTPASALVNSGVSSEVESIDPTQAAELLKKNTHNRRASKAQVNSLAEAMKNNLWVFDGAPIRIDINGTILDGQHRLQAVIQSKTVQEFLIVRGLQPESQYVMDTGMKRSLSGALSLEKYTNPNYLAAVGVAAFKWEVGFRGGSLTNGGFGGTAAPTLPTLLGFVTDRKEEFYAAISRGQKIAHTLKVIPRVATFTAWQFAQIDPEDADVFFASLASGANLAEGDPILVLRQRLLKISAERSQKTDPAVVLALITKAWNFWRDGATISHLKWSPGGAKKEPFPEPH